MSGNMLNGITGNTDIPSLQTPDLNYIQQLGTSASDQNALNSQALLAQIYPQVPQIQTNTQNTLLANSQNPYSLPTQVQQQAVQGAGITAGNAGVTGAGARAITAQDLGLSSLNVGNNQIAQQQADVLANPAPAVGVNPATLASIYSTGVTGANNYNLESAGLNAAAGAGALSGDIGIASSLGMGAAAGGM